MNPFDAALIDDKVRARTTRGRATMLALALAASASTLACASSSPGRGGWTTLPNGEEVVLVTFRIEDAMISPAKADGTPWDVATPIDEPNARGLLVNAMDHASNAKGAYDAATAAIARFGDAWGRPDVSGRASVDNGDKKGEMRALDGGRDSFTPRFGAEWSHVPLTHWTTVHMYLVDGDPGGNEDIGAVVLSPLDLAEALKHRGRVHHVRVDDQTNGQVLFVGISVTPEA
jgi:hypothetical protein